MHDAQNQGAKVRVASPRTLLACSLIHLNNLGRMKWQKSLPQKDIEKKNMFDFVKRLSLTVNSCSIIMSYKYDFVLYAN